jgi:hypothetical protein
MESNIIYQTLSNIVQRIKNAPENQPIDQMQDLKEVASKFKLSLPETLIVAILAVEDEDSNGLKREQLINYIKPVTGYNNHRISNLMRKLFKHHVIVRERFSESVSIALNEDYLEAIDTGNWESVESLTPYGLFPMLKYLQQFVGGPSGLFNRMNMPHAHLLDSRTEGLMRSNVFKINEHLACVKYINKHFTHLHEASLHLNLFFAILTKKVMEDLPTELEEWAENMDIARFESREFINKFIKPGNWPPIKHGLIEIVGGGRISESFSLELTERGVNELFAEFDDERKRNLNDVGIITVPHVDPKDISNQELIFSEELNRQFTPLKKAMDPQIQKRIADALGGRNGALTAIFYGHPGTGKTEFCYQMAKEFNLPIYKIDVAEIQSKWVGDSEKNARMVFSNYQKLCRQTKKRCILLFNEADALFSKRVDANSSVDQMNNALKNIFLEGMEELDGILFATTNLTHNFDPAFERRFLFKIKFEKSDIPTQAKVWHLYFPELEENQCHDLAKKFSLSPAQISNVRRKQIIDAILYPEKTQMQSIAEIAQYEKLDNDHNSKVGF